MGQNLPTSAVREKLSRIDLSGLKKYTVMFILLLLMILFSFMSPHFLTWRNLSNIITQNTYFIIVAIGLSFVMIGGASTFRLGIRCRWLALLQQC